MRRPKVSNRWGQIAEVSSRSVGLPSSCGARRHELRAFVFADWRHGSRAKTYHSFPHRALPPLPGLPQGRPTIIKSRFRRNNKGQQKPLGKLNHRRSRPRTDHASGERLPPTRRVEKHPKTSASQFSDGLIILKRGAERAAGRPAGAPRHKRQAAADPSDAPQPPRVKAAAAQPPRGAPSKCVSS